MERFHQKLMEVMLRLNRFAGLVQPSIFKGSALQNLQFNWKICHGVKLKKHFLM